MTDYIDMFITAALTKLDDLQSKVQAMELKDAEHDRVAKEFSSIKAWLLDFKPKVEKLVIESEHRATTARQLTRKVLEWSVIGTIAWIVGALMQ